MKKTLFLALTAMFFTGCFARCSTNPNTANLVKPTNNNIKNIHIRYYDWERANNKPSDYYGSDEFYDTFIEMDVSERYWDVIMGELTKRKKKVGRLTPMRNPGGGIGSIKITYNDGKETNVYLSRHSYFDINGDSYYYGHGPNFGFMREIIQEQKGL